MVHKQGFCLLNLSVVCSHMSPEFMNLLRVMFISQHIHCFHTHTHIVIILTHFFFSRRQACGEHAPFCLHHLRCVCVSSFPERADVRRTLLDKL